MRRTGLLVAGILAACAPGCAMQDVDRDAGGCDGDLLACPDLPACGATSSDEAGRADPEGAERVPLVEARPTGHRGLVGVLNRSKVLVSEDGSLLPQGLHPSETGDRENGFWLLPGGKAASWELVGAGTADPVVDMFTTRDAVRYRARAFGAGTEPPAISVRVTLENPGAANATATMALGFPNAPGPFEFDGRALAVDGEVRLLIRADEPVACAGAVEGTVSCRADLPPGSAREFEVLMLPPGAEGRVPAALPCSLDLQADARAAWDGALSSAATVEAPDPWLGNTFRRSLVHILLMRDPVEDFFVVKPGARAYNSFWYRDAAYIVRALDSVGLHPFAEESLRLFWNRPLPAEIEAMGTWDSHVAQYEDGRWECPNDEHDGTGQALWALVGHYEMGGDLAWLRTVYPAIRKGAAWLVDARQETLRGEHVGTAHEGLLPIGFGETLIKWDYVLNHNFWGVLGLRVAERAADVLGEAEDARRYREAREALAASVDRGVDAAFAEGYIQAAPGVTESRDHGSIATLYPCEVLATDDPRVDATFQTMWDNRALDLYKFPDVNKVWTYITADWAQALLLRGEWERATTLFEGFRRQASPVLGWWEELYLDSGAGTGDDPHGWAAANFVLWVRSMLMREAEDGDLELLRGVPPSWFVPGRPIRADRFPLRRGMLRSLKAEALDAAHLRIAWDVESEGGRTTGVTLFARGSTIVAADCDTAGSPAGDAVRIAALKGTCTLTIVASPAIPNAARR